MRRLASVLQQYRFQHEKMSGARMSLTDQAGSILGFVDRVEGFRGTIRVSGWAWSKSVTLQFGDHRVEDAPTLRRTDVAAVMGGSERVGFDLKLTSLGQEIFADQPLVVRLPEHSVEAQLTLDRSVQFRSVSGFLKRLFRASPMIIRHKMFPRPGDKGQIKRILGLNMLNAISTFVAHTASTPLKIAADIPPRSSKVAVIVPIFNAAHLLEGFLARLMEPARFPDHLVLINDASTDPDVATILSAWHQTLPEKMREATVILNNANNLGFVRSVNRGLEFAQERGCHAVLLNTDALVPAGWLDRLVAPFEANPEVASATPFSNNAEILSVPFLGVNFSAEKVDVDLVDSIAQRLPEGKTRAEIPTGVGFCMAMNRAWLNRLPQLDECFGRGYGEEVDWCQQLRKIGGRHVAVPNLFVAHVGGQSFGPDDKARLLQAGQKCLDRRYPGFSGRVADFRQSDPLATQRFLLGLGAAIQPGEPMPVFLAHSLCGGAADYLQTVLDGLPASVVLRLGGARRYQLELRVGDDKSALETDDWRFVTATFDLLPRRDFTYSCAVGDRDPKQFARDFAQMIKPERDSLDVLFHDYFPLSEDYTLLRPGEAFDPESPALGTVAWRAAWDPLLDRADRLVTFSDASRNIVASARPRHASKLVLRPHTLTFVPPRLMPATKSKPTRVVAVLGGIGWQKGVGLLNPLVAELARDGARLVVIGPTDPNTTLSPRITVHGAYNIRDIGRLAKRYGVTDWLIPSIWPETFCFTAHEALATGLPVFAFNIGGQGDAVGEEENGHPVTFGALDTLPARLANAMRAVWRTPVEAPAPAKFDFRFQSKVDIVQKKAISSARSSVSS